MLLSKKATNSRKSFFSLPFPKTFFYFLFPRQLFAPFIRWIIKSASPNERIVRVRRSSTRFVYNVTECAGAAGRKSGLLVAELAGRGRLTLSLSPPPPLFCTLCWSLNVLSNSITVGAMMFVRILYAFLNSSNLRVPIKTHTACRYMALCYAAGNVGALGPHRRTACSLSRHRFSARAPTGMYKSQSWLLVLCRKFSCVC